MTEMNPDPTNPNVVYVVKESPPGHGLIVTAFVSSIIGFFLGLVPILFALAWAGGAVGIVCGLVGRVKSRRVGGPTRMATWAIVIGVLAFALGIVGIVIVQNALDDMSNYNG